MFLASGAARPMKGGIRTVATPVDHASVPAAEAGAAPELGQHTEEILLELGFDWDRIGALRAEGVV